MLAAAVVLFVSGTAAAQSGPGSCPSPASLVGTRLEAAKALLKKNGCEGAEVTECATPARSNGTVLLALRDASLRTRIVLVTGSPSSRYCHEADTVTAAAITPAGPGTATTTADKAVAVQCAIFEKLAAGSAPVVAYALTSRGCDYVILPGPSSQGIAGTRFKLFVQNRNVCRNVSNLPNGYRGTYHSGTTCRPA